MKLLPFLATASLAVNLAQEAETQSIAEIADYVESQNPSVIEVGKATGYEAEPILESEPASQLRDPYPAVKRTNYDSGLFSSQPFGESNASRYRRNEYDYNRMSAHYSDLYREHDQMIDVLS